MRDHFVFKKRVGYHETDAMGVIHHSNHIKYFEDARVAWLRDRGVMEFHQPRGPLVFAVVDLSAKYYRPARFDDQIEVWVQTKLDGMRILFQYGMGLREQELVLAEGHTTLVPLTADFKVARVPQPIRSIYEQEPWAENWADFLRTTMARGLAAR